MPLNLYKRGEIFWFKGRIEELPNSRYYRQSTGKTSEAGAQAVLNEFQHREVKKFYGGEKSTMTFAEAVTLYDADPETAKDLLAVLDHLGDMLVSEITPKLIKDLGPQIYPKNSTDSWRRHVVTPVRAVINNAHHLGHCALIRVDAYTSLEHERQDRARGKLSRQEKTPGSWPWINRFRAHAPPHVAALALFMFETAARIGQATLIRFEDFDEQNAKVQMPGAKGFKAEPVELSPELTRELGALQPRYTRRHTGKLVKSDRLFGYQGKDGVRGIWKRICRDAGIEVIMPHAAGRHGFGTEMLVRQGLDPVTVAKAGRWSDPKMLMDRYAHAENYNARIQKALRTGRVQSKSKSGDNYAE